MADYQKQIVVKSPVHKVYLAITNHIGDWWSNDLHGEAAAEGDIFDIAFGGTHKSFQILKAIPDSQIIWKCMKAYIDMASLKNKSEWENTEILWTLQGSDTQSIISFVHKGLKPAMECYTVCEPAWDSFLASLEQFINTGKGAPHRKTTLLTNDL